MFDFLKKLMGKGEPEKPAPAAAPQKAPPAEKSAPPAPAAPKAPAKPAPAPAPAAAKSNPAPAPAPAPAAPAPAAASIPAENVTLTLSAIIAKLSPEFQGKVQKKPGNKDTVTLPIKKLAEQLQQGSVKIPVGDLVKAAPPSTFQGIDASDATPIDLPLAEILAKISPTLLTRRANQKKVEVPADVVGLFGPAGGKGTKVAPVSGAPIEDAKSAPPAPAPAPVAPPAPPPPAPVAAEPAPAPAPAAPPPPPEPAAPIQISSSLRDLMSAASASAAATPTPSLKPTGTAPVAPATQKLPVSAPSAPPAPSAPAAKPPGTEGMITVALTAISASWPDAVKLEAESLGNAQVEIPVKIVADTLRQGKLIYQWRQIKGWLKPSPGAPSANDDTAVELPMQVITPLFLAARPAPAKAQKKVAIDETIPSMFAQRTATPAGPAATPTAHIAPAKAASDLGTLFGQAEKTTWTPKEIVQKASTLPGVAGAIIALQDGLVVESHLPPTLKGDTVAGFLPQIFSRINQYTKEMQIGELNGLILFVDHVPWQIFKAGSVYFAALGRVGETLPSAQLTVIATELGRQNNK